MTTPQHTNPILSHSATRWLIIVLIAIGVLTFEVFLNLILLMFFGHTDKWFCASTDVYCSPYRTPGPTPATYIFWVAQIIWILPLIFLTVRVRRLRETTRPSPPR